MANFAKMDGRLFKKCTGVGHNVSLTAEHVHNLQGQFLEDRIDARGHQRGTQWDVHA